MVYPTLGFGEFVCQQSIQELIMRVRYTPTSRIVLIDSPGGEFEFFNTLAPALLRESITTLAGEATSAATILYLLGENRLAFPDATFHFTKIRAIADHDDVITILDQDFANDMAEMLEEEDPEGYAEELRNMQAAESWYLKFLSEHTGIDVQVFLNLMKDEVTLNAVDAMRYGFVHRIVPYDHFLLEK